MQFNFKSRQVCYDQLTQKMLNLYVDPFSFGSPMLILSPRLLTITVLKFAQWSMIFYLKPQKGILL